MKIFEQVNQKIYLVFLSVIATYLFTSCTSSEESTYNGQIIIREQGSFAVGGTVITNPGTFDPYNQTPAGQTFHGDHAYVF